MIQIVTSWNLSNPRSEAKETINKIKLRGYNTEDVYLTGELAARIKENELRSLSVSDIADLLCPTRRDLYINKGRNRAKDVDTKPRWGRIAGQVVERYIYDNFEDLRRKKRTTNYRTLRYKVNRFTKEFIDRNSNALSELAKLKTRAEEDPHWLIKLLNINGRIEYGLKNMHNVLQKNGRIDVDIHDIETNRSNSLKINPTPSQIGISRGIKPDFRVSKLGIIGDIKSGVGGFQDRYLLTCAGYALANENEKGKKGNINFGIIYLLPTRYSGYVKPVSFAQVYIFPIDDPLRQWFIDTRNQAYAVIAKIKIPRFPKLNKRDACALYCKYYDYCKSQGLKYEEKSTSSN
jgi:CRISPR/Cas system-associated exonuclease Cas4 (RecB family)